MSNMDLDESPAVSASLVDDTTMAMAEEPAMQLSLNNSISTESLNLDTLSREELYDKIRRLQTHVKQLRNIILKRKICHLEKYDESSLQTSMAIKRTQNQPNHAPGPSLQLQSYPPSKKKKQDRPFDFEKCPKRHVALKIAYLGWSYAGLAAQEDSDETIETYLFDALIKAKLIESRATSNYHRCGRTDKGVSAFSQVISIDVRCNATDGLGVILPESWPEEKRSASANKNVKELQFCRMINRLLPRDIRVLAWAPVRADFSARFDCERRTYKYYFPDAPGLDVDKMRTAAQFLIGDHDFRNFCKLETAQFRRVHGGEQKSTVRTVLSVELDKVQAESCPSTLYVFTIHGQSFVWHQIRCIVAILLLIGKGLEAPSLVQELLDIENNPKKPQYAMAVDFPLVLFYVSHGDEIKENDWIWDDTDFTLCGFQALWVQHDVKAAMIAEMINEMRKQLAKDQDKPQQQSSNANAGANNCDSDKKSVQRWQHEHLNALIMGTKAKCYQKILDRPTCERS